MRRSRNKFTGKTFMKIKFTKINESFFRTGQKSIKIPENGAVDVKSLKEENSRHLD
jgi:hypothetical protein